MGKTDKTIKRLAVKKEYEVIDDLGGATSQIVKLALDAAVQKHNVIANNIANANTPGFAPQAMQFETLLAQLENDKDIFSTQIFKEKIDLLREEVNGGALVESKGPEKVELDVEMADMAENVLKYRALLEGLAKRGAILSMAITGQRG